MSIDRTLSLQKVFVPLKIAASYYDLARPEMIPLVNDKVNTLEEKQIWDFLTPKVDNPTVPRIVVLGAPGSGKTTLLKHLTLIYAMKQQKQYDSKAPKLIPVLLYIRNVYKEIIQKQPSLADLITEKVKQQNKAQKLNPPPNWFSQKLSNNQQCLVMLDGLDEVADEFQRQQVSRWVDEQMQSYPNTTFIVTSRPKGYQSARLTQSVLVLEVQSFNLQQIKEFIHNWYLQTEINSKGENNSKVREIAQRQADELIKRIINNAPLASMAVNPLLLTMIATVHQRFKFLPEKRSELYKLVCEVLLEERQNEKKISDKLNLDIKQKQLVLQKLALWLMEQKARDFKLSDGISLIKKELVNISKAEIKPEFFIKHIRDVCGLLVEKELKSYQFAHLSFQEYLAAVEIHKHNLEELLIANIENSWWTETIHLYAAQSDVSKLIRAVLMLPSPSVNVMVLAYKCLEESLVVDSSTKEELIKRLEEGLESTDPEIFKLAAQVRLKRRLNNFLRIDEDLEIDNSSYITCAEYQLFIDEEGEGFKPQHWETSRFSQGNARENITGISREDANRFCIWLKFWSEKQGLSNDLSELINFYRLYTEEDKNQHDINDEHGIEDGIRLVRFRLHSKYSQLVYHLWNSEWQKADEETGLIMLKIASRNLDIKAIQNFPCKDLGIIDKLWVYASQGRFGFSVQKKIYKSLGGKSEYNEKIWDAFGKRVGWRKREFWQFYSELTFDTSSAPEGHLPVIGEDKKSEVYSQDSFYTGSQKSTIGRMVSECMGVYSDAWIGIFLSRSDF